MERCAKLLISNVPVDCPDDFLKRWIEARGYLTFGVKVTHDSDSQSAGFAYVQLMDISKLDEAARCLDGQNLHQQKLQVRRVQMTAIVRSAA